MPREIITKAAFDRAYRRLTPAERHLVDNALRRFDGFLKTGEAPVGLGIKHLGSKTYEFRAGLALRIVYVVEPDRIVLSLLGNHDEVRRFLRHQ